MRGWIRGGLIAASVGAACQFSPRSAPGDGGDAPSTPDSGTCVQLSAECADPATLRTCTAIGEQPTDTPCSWGCLGPNAHCGRLVPVGGGALPGDLDPDDLHLLDVTLNGKINSDTGQIGTVRQATASGQLDGGIYFYVRNNIAVFRAKSIHVTSNMTAAGARPIVLVATDSITFDATLDARGDCMMTHPGPGGFAGGTAGSAAPGSGGGSGGGGDGKLGGGGGGNGGSGGSGGIVDPVPPAPGGPPFGDATITVLVGGGGGGGGGHGGAPLGGGGGGAIQLVAGTTITISGTGEINAGGCGGTNGANGDSGGGGGAGGTIVLEAHDVAIAGRLAVNGGGGGAGGGGTNGDKGDLTRSRASGGGGGDGVGGAAGAGSNFDGLPGIAGSMHSGGGAGAVGRMRFNTRAGSATVDNTKLSPALDDPGSTTTEGVATVQ